MGLDAELLGVGKFSQLIAKNLDYPEEYYKNIPEGTVIITKVVGCVNTQDSLDLAESLDIYANNLVGHCDIHPEKADLELMRQAAEASFQVDDFIALREAGFTFYYMPNG